MTEPAVRTDHLMLDGNGRIDENLDCVRCGYNLRSLMPDAVCPECAARVSESTRPDLLRFADIRWRRSLALGTLLMLAGITGYVVIIVLFAALAFSGLIGILFQRLAGGWGSMIIITSTGLPLLICCLGYWAFTRREPGWRHNPLDTHHRLISRIALALMVILMLVEWISQSTVAIPASLPRPLWLGLICVWVVTFGIYAKQLALRVPNEPLARYTRWITFGWSGYLVCSFAISLVIAWFASRRGGDPRLFSFYHILTPAMGIIALVLWIGSIILAGYFHLILRRIARPVRT